jgi:hypothetical protein
LFFKGHFLSKFSVLVKFIVYLPASSELGVSLRKTRNIQGNVFVIIAICSKFIVLVFEGAGVVWAFQ